MSTNEPWKVAYYNITFTLTETETYSQTDENGVVVETGQRETVSTRTTLIRPGGEPVNTGDNKISNYFNSGRRNITVEPDVKAVVTTTKSAASTKGKSEINDSQSKTEIKNTGQTILNPQNTRKLKDFAYNSQNKDNTAMIQFRRFIIQSSNERETLDYDTTPRR